MPNPQYAIRNTKFFAVIPGAGRSRRMGQPKLTLPLGDRSVVRHLLDALDRPAIAARVVVMRRDDEALQAEVAKTKADIVQPDVDPPDMRASVQHALDHIAANFSPDNNDAWLLVPADHPAIDPNVIDRLLDRWKETSADILIPTANGRRGHPTLFRWSLVEAVREIPADQGLNALVEQFAGSVEEFPVNDGGILADVDTPEDYARLRNRFDETDTV